MAKKLFVGGLPFSTSEEELKNLFAQYGTLISAIVITDKYSGKSKGFGFVEFENDADADKAIAALHDSEVGGRKITVNVARPKEDRGPQNFNS